MNFNWKPQKLPLQMINGNSRAASEAMAGYIPAEADPNNPYYTQGIPAENATALMQGYTEEQPAPYVGRTPENMNNAGQGEGYQFNDPEFDAYMQQQEKAANEAAAKQQKIDDIKSQIQTLESRIAENTKKLQGFGNVANKVAALEARKINSQDPTMVWRWKAQMDENRKIAEKANGTDNTAKANAMIEIANDLDSIIVDNTMTSQDKKVYLSKLSNMKTLGEKAGVPKSVIDNIEAKIKEVKGNGDEQTSREKAKTDWKGLKGKPDLTSKEIQTALDNPDMNWDPDERKEAENLRDKLKKHEAATQSVKNMKNWLSSNYGIDYNQLDPDEQKSWQEIWKAQK